MSAVGLGRREPCVVCNQPVFLAQRLLVERRLYHRTCFTCARCGTQLSLAGCYQTETDGQFCCETCPDEDVYRDDDQHSDENSSIQSAPVSIDSLRKKFESKDADDSVSKRNVYNRTASDEEKTRNLNKYNEALIAESSAYDESRKELSAKSVTSSKALSGFLNSQFDKDSDDEDVVPALPKSLPPAKSPPTERPLDALYVDRLDRPGALISDVSPVVLAETVGVSQPLFRDSGLVVSARATFAPATSASDADRLVSDLSLKSELIGRSPLENKLPDIHKNVSDAPLATSESIVSTNLSDDEVEMKSDVYPSAEDDKDKPRDVNIDKSHVNQLDTASDLKEESNRDSSGALDDVERNAKIDDAIAKDSQRSSKTPDAFDDRTVRNRETASPEPSDRSLVKMRMKVFESASPETESRLGRMSTQRSNVDQSNLMLSKFSLSSKDDVPRNSYSEPVGKTATPGKIDTSVAVLKTENKSDSKVSDESNSHISLSDVPCNDTMPYIISTIFPPTQDITTAPDAIVNLDVKISENDRSLEITPPDIINTEAHIDDLADDGDKIIDKETDMSSEENIMPSLLENDSVSEKMSEDTTVQKDDVIEKQHVEAIPASDINLEKEEEVIPSDTTEDENIDVKVVEDTETVVANEIDNRPALDESNVSLMVDSSLSLSKSVREEIYPEDLNPFGDDEDEEEALAKNKINTHPQIPQRRSAMSSARDTLTRGTHSDINVELSPPKKVSTNPFGSSSDEDEPVKGNVSVKKKSGQKPPRPPPPAILINAMKSKTDTSDSKRLIPAPSINLNPFWSEGDEENSDEEGHKQTPVPTPRQRLSDGQNPSPMPRYSIGVGPPPSFHSSSSSLASTISRRKKAPAPKPPSSGPPIAAPRKISDAESVDDLHDISFSSRLSTPNSSMSHISPQVSPRTRKRRPAPLPPAASSTLLESPSMDYSLNFSGPQSLQLPPQSSPIIHAEEISKSSIGFSNSKRVIQVDDFNDGNLDDTLLSEWDGDNSTIDEKSKNRLSAESEGLSPLNKSTAGQWKRRKGPAPAVPLLQRRAAGPPLAPAALRRELQLLEAQQRGLEKQGVRLEEIIREKCEGNDLPEGVVPDPDPETDELVMQLFELVNEKNELFRRQAELMYIRRQQRLEEEYADLEHQIRCLMAQPELNKTDSDKAREEQLIQRLVEVVERRNEVVTSLEMDRLREREEDKSIRERMASHRAKLDETNSPMDSPKKKEKKKDKKKWMKRDKAKKSEAKNEGSDVNDADSLKKEKKMKKWFTKTGNS